MLGELLADHPLTEVRTCLNPRPQGGGSDPGQRASSWTVPPPQPRGLTLAVILLQVGVVCGKVLALVGLVMALRWTLPRFRYDQLMRLAWEGMIPTAMLMLLVTAVFVFLGLDSEGLMWIGSLGVIIVIWLGRPLIARKTAPNHRVGLRGSRFSPEEAIDS